MRFTADSLADDDACDRLQNEVNEFTPGERICAPSSGEAVNTLAWVYAVFGAAVALALIALHPMPGVLDVVVSSIRPAPSDAGRSGDPMPNETGAAPAARRSISETVIAPPVAIAGTPAQPAQAPLANEENAAAAPEQQPAKDIGAEPRTASENTHKGSEAPTPLPAPRVDPADRLQVKALAAGLNPALSRGLLERLSSADYRNAKEAVQRALGSGSDDEVVVWPQSRQRKLAQFQVHFVPAVSRDCRRYVVKIAKDGWATTAPPMEKCGFGTG